MKQTFFIVLRQGKWSKKKGKFFGQKSINRPFTAKSPPHTDVPLFYSKNSTCVLFKRDFMHTWEILVGKIPGVVKVHIEKWGKVFGDKKKDVFLLRFFKHFFQNLLRFLYKKWWFFSKYLRFFKYFCQRC